MALAEVERNVCDYCCTQFEPRPGLPNPMVASLLYRVAAHAISQGGLEGVTVEDAEALQRLAISHLPIEGTDPEPYQKQRTPYAGPCFFLGRETGSRECESCRGKVRRKTFACHHEQLGDETVIKECQRCPAYERRLATDGARSVTHWAVAVTTAPRKEATLELSLESLARAGWAQPLVFAEPGTDLPAGLEPERITRRRRTFGAWPNFFATLTELCLLEPKADAYLLCQDDVLYAEGLRDYLEDQLWPAETLGVVSLHTASHQDRGDREGFFPADLGWDAWGAQAYVFPNAAARAFLRNVSVVNHRHRGPRDGLCNVDSVVGQWCRDSGLDYYLHTPSLTQHVGDTSTLWENARTKGRRIAATFNGEVGRARSE